MFLTPTSNSDSWQRLRPVNYFRLWLSFLIPVFYFFRLRLPISTPTLWVFCLLSTPILDFNFTSKLFICVMFFPLKLFRPPKIGIKWFMHGWKTLWYDEVVTTNRNKCSNCLDSRSQVLLRTFFFLTSIPDFLSQA